MWRISVNKDDLTILDLSPKAEADISVVTLTNAPSAIINKFTEDQIKQGVSSVIVYLDDPSNIERAILTSSDKINYVDCDEDFWWLLGFADRSVHVEKRQVEVFQYAYGQAQTAWIGFCNIDERFVPYQSFGELFDRVPEHVQELRGRSCEAVWLENSEDFSDFSATHCRTPIWRNENVLLQQRRHPLFSALSQRGLVGHPYGKYIIRSGIEGIVLSIHGVRVKQGAEMKPLVSMDNTVQLLHYDAIGFNAWESKFKQRLDPSFKMGGQAAHRKAITQLLATSKDRDFRLGVFKILYTLDENRLKWMKSMGVVRGISA